MQEPSPATESKRPAKKATRARPKKAATRRKATKRKSVRKRTKRPPDEPNLRFHHEDGAPGRPRIEWTEKGKETFRMLSLAGNTIADSAAILGVSKSWLEKQLSGDEEIGGIFRKANAETNSSLRTWQLQAARRGNPTMQIWLGKNRLGQRDYRALEVTGAGGGPLEIETELRPLLEDKLREFARASKVKPDASREAASESSAGTEEEASA